MHYNLNTREIEDIIPLPVGAIIDVGHRNDISGNTMYLTIANAQSVYRIDLRTHEVVQEAYLGDDNKAFAGSSDNLLLAVSHEDSGIHIFDQSTFQKIGVLPIQNNPATSLILHRLSNRYRLVINTQDNIQVWSFTVE